MKIYFAGSIRGGSQDAAIYRELIQHLARHGQVLTEHVADPHREMQKGWTDGKIWEQDMAWLRQSQVVVAECTVPSLGVGYELGIAETLQIPVLCLFRGKPAALSAMVTGNPHFVTACYTHTDEAKAAIDGFIQRPSSTPSVAAVSE
ncbi:hypothetical protein HDV03_000942 [Kappamyces sp. JEL0829]|nr:hypothetical protein HDV03_000942 [Kappamyces sp. JEL0829]